VQTTSVSVDRLADHLMHFFLNVIKGEQDTLLQVIADLELTIPQMRGMFILGGSEEGLTLTELAPRMGLSIAAGGRAIDGLARLDLVSRHEDSHDRRVKRLAVTEAGRDALARIAQARREDMRRYAATLGERERAVLADALETVFAAAGDQEAPR